MHSKFSLYIGVRFLKLKITKTSPVWSATLIEEHGRPGSRAVSLKLRVLFQEVSTYRGTSTVRNDSDKGGVFAGGEGGCLEFSDPQSVRSQVNCCS